MCMVAAGMLPVSVLTVLMVRSTVKDCWLFLAGVARWLVDLVCSGMQNRGPCLASHMAQASP